MAAKGSVIARILSEYSDKGTKAARKDLVELQNNFHEFGKKATEAFAVAGAAGLAFAAQSVKLAIEDQKSQAILANVLRNTTGANEEAIASADEYIKKTQLRLGINDTELRPSLQALVTATRDVTKAESLQQLAMDISAGRGKDLGAVSIALAKAYDGNFSALKRLGIPLSETLVKSKDFVGITKELSAAVNGSATVAADTLAVRMARVKLSFEEAQKSLGYALMPAVQGFLDILINKVLPSLQKFIDANKDKLVAALQSAATTLGDLIKNAVSFGTWLASHIVIVKEFAVAMAAMWAYGKVLAFVSAIEKIVAVMRTLRTVAAGAAVAEALATGGGSVAAGLAALAVAGIGTAWVIAGNEARNAGKDFQTAKEAADPRAYGGSVNDRSGTQAATIGANYNAIIAKTSESDRKAIEAAKARAAINAQIAKDQAASARSAAIAAAKAAKDAAKQYLLEKSIAALKKLGVTPTDNNTDPNELEAARLNLVKQGNIADAEKLGITLALIDAQMQSNQAIQRYSDILQALADDHISSSEIETLAKKWGISQDAVVAYIAQVTGAAAWDPKDLGSPGAVAADGWKNALTALNAYYNALKSGTIMAPSAGGSAAITPSPTSPDVAAIVAAATPQSGTGNIGINYNQPGSTSLFASSGSSAWGLGSANPGVNYNQPPTVNITVQGSVVTQNDLVTAVTAGIQQNIISGRSVSFSNTGL